MTLKELAKITQQTTDALNQGTNKLINSIGYGLKTSYDITKKAVKNKAEDVWDKINDFMYDMKVDGIAGPQDRKDKQNELLDGLKTPTQEPPQTPTQTPTETPSQTPTQTPSQTPSQTPTETPSQTPSTGVLDNEKILNDATKMLEKYWEREDAIRKETQAREDSAYQRAVKDMRLAGINPNLVGINPANSGGGITTATQRENILGQILGTQSQEKINKAQQILTKTVKEIELLWQREENDKNREIQIADTVFSAITSIVGMAFGMLKGG